MMLFLSKRLPFYSIVTVFVKLLLFIACLSSSSYAQTSNAFEGFLVKKNGEKVFGKLKVQHDERQSIRLKGLLEKRYLQINLEEVDFISNGMDVEYLVMDIIEEERSRKIIVKKVVSGSINLYRGESTKGNDIYFINSKNIPRTVQIHPKGVNSFIKNYFRDCPRKEERIYYKYSNIVKAIQYYQRCLYQEHPIIILEKPNNNFTFGLGYRGMYFTTTPSFPKRSYYAGGNFNANPSGGGGFFAKAYLKKRWSLQFGANILKYRIFDNEFISPIGRSSDIEFNITLLELPVELTYYFNVPFQPHFFIGYTPGYLLRPKIKEEPFNINQDPPQVIFKDETIGFQFGIGVKRMLSPKAELLLQVKYLRESIRINTWHFDPFKFNYVTTESKINPNRLEVSASYVFLIEKK